MYLKKPSEDFQASRSTKQIPQKTLLAYGQNPKASVISTDSSILNSMSAVLQLS